MSGLLNCLSFVLATEENASAAEPCANELLNMRLQLESRAREDRLFRMRDKNWIGAPAMQCLGPSAPR